jgi:hypothetical protein
VSLVGPRSYEAVRRRASNQASGSSSPGCLKLAREVVESVPKFRTPPSPDLLPLGYADRRSFLNCRQQQLNERLSAPPLLFYHAWRETDVRPMVRKPRRVQVVLHHFSHLIDFPTRPTLRVLAPLHRTNEHDKTRRARYDLCQPIPRGDSEGSRMRLAIPRARRSHGMTGAPLLLLTRTDHDTKRSLHTRRAQD